jgi:molecular chaperone GrpE
MEEKKNKKNGSGNGDEAAEELNKAKKRIQKHSDKMDLESEIEIKQLIDEIGLLRKELAHYKKTEEDYLDKLQRCHADYDNFRKRAAKERIDIITRASKDIIEKLLPILDNFDHAIAAGESLKDQEDEFFKGVKMIHSALLEMLQKEGLSIIYPEGEEFNPHECEVAVTEDVADVNEGIVLDVLRKGYKLNNFLLRPAVVKVCRKS